MPSVSNQVFCLKNPVSGLNSWPLISSVTIRTLVVVLLLQFLYTKSSASIYTKTTDDNLRTDNFNYNADLLGSLYWSVLSDQGLTPVLVYRYDPVYDRRVIIMNGRAQIDFPDIANKAQAPSPSFSQQPQATFSTLPFTWTLQTASHYQLSMHVRTSFGPRELVYTTNTSLKSGHNNNQLLFGVSRKSLSGRWVKLGRDLAVDLQRREPGNHLIEVQRLSFTGNLKLAKFSIGSNTDVAHANTMTGRVMNQPAMPGTISSQTNPDEIVTPEKTNGESVSNHLEKTAASAEYKTKEQTHEPAIAASLPALQTHTWSLQPYLVAARNSYNRENVLEEESNYAGITASYTGKTVNFYADIYPDFALVDQQLNDISFSYDEKKTKDPRPFFGNHKSFFGAESDYFYSQRIPNFNAGVKSYFDLGPSKVGLLLVESPEDRRDLHAHYNFKSSKHSLITLDSVISKQKTLNHQLLGATIKDRFTNNLFYLLKGAVSQQEENIDADNPDEDTGHTVSMKLGWNPGALTFSYSSDYYKKSYNPVNALIKRDLPGTRGSAATVSYYKSGTGTVREIIGDFTLNRRDTLAQETQNRGIYASAGFELLSHARINFSYNNYNYRQAGDELGEFREDTTEDEYWSTDLDMNINGSRFGYGFSYADGELGGGEYEYLSGYAWLKPHKNLNFKLSRENLTSYGKFQQTSVRGTWSFLRNHKLLAVYNEGDQYQQWRLAYQYSLPWGQEIFLGFHRLSDAKDEFIGKFVWTLK